MADLGGRVLTGRALTRGVGTGPVIVLAEPVSIWGGVDHRGTIIDKHHPDVGTALTGAVLVMESGRGSSSASSVLAELIRSGHAPAAIVLQQSDAILALGAMVADELYGLTMPVVEVVGVTGLDVGGAATVASDIESGVARLTFSTFLV